MKKILVMGAAVIGLMLGASATAAATTTTDAYPIDPPISPTWTGPLEGYPNQALVYTVDHVLPGEVVTVKIGDSSYSAVAGGGASAYDYRTVKVNATAPAAAGKYPSTISISKRNLGASFTFTVKPRGDGGGGGGGGGGNTTSTTMAKPMKKKLPATGSNSAGTMAAWALALLGGGSALVYVSKRRNVVN